jgi:CubicO group peptidase (beta-lactamase class C family)
MTAAAISDAARADVDRLVDEFRERHRIPGIAYGIVASGHLVHSGGIGRLAADASGRPDQDSRSRICSMSKSFVAAAVLKLRDDGLLALADPASVHAPELRSVVPPTADSPDVSIHDLLSMGSGLPADDAWADRLLDIDDAELDTLLRSGFTFSTAPRTVFEYSNLGWVLLGRVVSRVSGMPVQRFVTTEILAPLGLESTTWTTPVEANVMRGHRWRGDWVEEPAPLADGGFAAIGGLWSTVADLARWVGFLVDAFPPRDELDDGPLCRASRREMQQVHRARRSTFDAATNRLDAGGYGYGLVVTHDLRFGHVVSHSGGLPGFGSDMRWLPDRHLGIVALANVTYAPMRVLTVALLEHLDDHDELPPPHAIRLPEALDEACGRLERLLRDWDSQPTDNLFTANVFLDKDDAERRADAERLSTRLGTWRSGPVEATTATSGSFTLRGDGGEATISVKLSPEHEPRIQSYEIQVSDSSP